MEKLVTKESLAKLVTDQKRGAYILGRALVAIFNNQVEDEKSQNATILHNGIGFTGADARCGSIAAKTFLKRGHLMEWQIKSWTMEKRGYPRICKYAEQLNKIANLKQQSYAK
jgi:hypothetical protein